MRAAEPAAARPAAGPALVPSSAAQQRLWFLDHLYPGTALYSVPIAIALRGPLDADALRSALSGVVARHEVLRATFPTDGRGLVQRIEPELGMEMPIIHVAEVSEAWAAVQQEAWQPFSLAEAPLLRASLLRLGVEHHVLVLAVHHAVFDGWSEQVLFDDLSQLYTALVLGTRPPPALPVQYRDFAERQRQDLATGRLDAELEYWRGRLADAAGLLDLPADRRRPAVPSFRGAVHRSFLPGPLWETLRSTSRSWRATPFMTLLAVFAALLGRYGGTEDLVVGTPAAGRTRPEWEQLIGLFANTLPVRLDLSGSPTLRELTVRTRASVLEAYEHQAVPFERLVQALRPDRSLSHNPLFQVLFTSPAGPQALPRLPGVRAAALDPGSRVAKFDLSLAVEPHGRGAVGRLEYTADLFDRDTAAAIGRRFRRLLTAALADPETPLAKLPLLGPEERRQVLVDWNGTERRYPEERLVHEMFADCAASAPDVPAVRFEGEEVSYGELNRRANRLAHHLRRLDVGPDTVVALLLDRSVDLVVSLLAVLKADGAYLPLSPDDPAQRLASMLGRSGARLVITSAELASRLGATDAEVLCLEALSGLAGLPDHEPRRRAHLDNLAYVIYTSGSTGEPKGVMISHRGLLNRILWMQEAYGLTPGEGVLQKTPYTFDVSVWEFLWPLTFGARLVLARPGGHREPAYLADLVAAERVTTVHFVPAMLGPFLEQDRLQRCVDLKRVVCSGESLPVDLQDRFFRRLDRELHNLYGPTEASIDVTAWACRRDLGEPTVPIGRPIANSRALVLDSELELQPAGVPGELFLSGVGLARGYLGRPDLTAARFLPDPLSPIPGGRMYRTGDLARCRPDGNLEVRGRIDSQIKLRGFRIELGEIEAALLDHPAVAAAAVVVQGRSQAQRQLVGYFVGHGHREPDVIELKRFLRDRLPEYMVPSSLIAMPALPLTSSGKVDRKALPPSKQAEPAPKARVARRTAVQDTIAGIWCSTLELAEVGLDDNFFDVGGQSLLLVAVQGELNRAFQVDVPLTLLFQRPTVRALAEHFAEGGGESLPVESRRRRGAARREAGGDTVQRPRRGRP